MKTQRRGGGLFAALLFISLIMFGIFLPKLSTEQRGLRPQTYAELYPSANPSTIEDQLGARRITEMGRTLEDEYNYLQEKYATIPASIDLSDSHLSQDNFDRFLIVYVSYLKQDKDFRKRVMGKNPGFFRVVAVVGVIGNVHEVNKTRSLVKAGLREEEFWHIYRQLMWAGLYCLQYMLDHEPISDELKTRLLELRDPLYIATGVSEMDETGAVTFFEDRLRLDQVPRSNIKLFLDNYLRTRYPGGIDFKKPIPIDFPAAAIMPAAANNPP